MAFWSAANLSANLSAEECNITSDFHEYFDTVYNGVCMEHHNSLNHCSLPWFPCDVTSYRKSSDVHRDVRYTDSSLAWVLIAAIIVFFMKAGFMQLEIAFANELDELRSIVIYKYMDACASAFGFFLIGFDYIARYRTSHCIQDKFSDIYDPVLWFFKFTFASNAATILGGCLVTNKYKLRLPAVFVSAFVISGIIHPVVTFFIWSDSCTSLSPYRFCKLAGCHLDCSSYFTKAYFLDFAGGGAVHLLGGTAGLMICLFAKLQKYIDEMDVRLCWPLHYYYQPPVDAVPIVVPQGESADGPEGFWDTMYSDMGGKEFVHSSALGVLILWFAWFAFNCGSTESVEGGEYGTYHAVPARIAINMIMCCAAGGLLAITIASWAQLTYGTKSINANEVSNGILSCLVAITASCPYVNYWSACVIGIIAVIVYHLGCYAEYKLGIEDTAKVVPVHGVCGLWSLVAVGLFVQDLPLLRESLCYLHATFEGLCYCSIRLPYLNWIERFGAQIIGAMLILLLGMCSGLVYGILYIIPINGFVKLFCFRSKVRNLYLHGGLLLTSPYDKFVSDSGGIPTRAQRNPCINTEQTPLLTNDHTPRHIYDDDTVQEGPSSTQTELLDPVGRGAYATFSGQHSSRETFPVKKPDNYTV